MHNKKIITKGLALGLVLSNTPVDSMANLIEEYNINNEENKDFNLKKEEREYKVIEIKESLDSFFENLFNKDKSSNKLRKESKQNNTSKEIIKVNPNVRTGTVLEIRLTDSTQFVQDLSGNPGGYETVRVITEGDKKLVEADYDKLRQSGIPKVDLSNSYSDSIPASAFTNATHLVEFKFPQEVNIIEDGSYDYVLGYTGAFSNCNNLTELAIPNTITSIGDYAFAYCSGFTGDIIIPEGVIEIRQGAFLRCSGFDGNIVISDTVEYIRQYAFSECRGLKGELMLSSSLTSIEGSAFNDCNGLTGNLTIPDSVTSIGSYAFNGCNRLTGNLVIPNSVTSIGNGAFQNCSGFSGNIIIPDSINQIGSNVFKGMTNIKKIFIKVDDTYKNSNYRKVVIEKLPIDKTYLEISYNLNIVGTWLESTSYMKSQPTIGASIGTFENNEGICIFLIVPEVSTIKDMTILKDGEYYTLEKTDSEKYIFNEVGEYQIYIETELGTISDISFKNNSPVYKPSLKYENNSLTIIDNGVLLNDSIIASDILEYRINGSDWQRYSNSVELNYPGGTKVLIEARAKHDGFVSSILSQEITVESKYQEIEDAIKKAEESKDINDISDAREMVNTMPESSKKNEFQNKLNDISVDLTLDKKGVTSNLDLYIKSENMLRVTLSTNSITFDDFAGIDDVEKENAINLTVNSSLPYKINAYMPTDIKNSDGTNIMNKDILNIRANGQINYNTFVDKTTPIVLLDDQPADNDAHHGIDLMLKGNLTHVKDVYKTTIKFEVEQK